ncbi:cholesterol oxidase [Nocardioides alpinus]|uniref:Cholesterol oxidase n=1 Tax=Nocardioides alpinus TaxID=748909 RepID=A0A1I0YLK8_9ACTN|nr:GMC family oxidoreductase [Nocardioides alpinus]PKH43545.1 GMC family oxidoreductase [Nocardioides alpinus]SFB13188.1 cholesterol oxidase [Nocardioides alpinus]
MSPTPRVRHYDVLVIGSGFGGSVTALRLTEKGYRVGVLEAGARFSDDELPEHGGDVKSFIFRPEVGLYGIQRIDLVRDCFILAGAGVGGGSLNYANTLYEPPEPFYKDPQWAHITDWKAELAPYYDQARRMLGVTDYARTTPADVAMKEVADEMGVGDTFHPTPVGVFFGEPGQAEGETVADPFFGGAGPERATCINCGSCMTGCRHNAKNTLVKNYLYLAEQNGAVVHPLTTVTDVRPRPGGGYEVTARWTKAKLSRKGAVKTFTADHVVFSAAAIGTQRLLHRLKAEGSLPKISDRLGVLTRTNSEAILWATANDDAVDWTDGVAITSSFHPDEHTHVEPVRYGRGRNVMPLMATVLVDEVLGEKRWRTWGKELWRQRDGLRDLYSLNTWSRRTVVALVMQTLDNSITTVWRTRGGVGYMSSTQGHGAPNPTYIAPAYDAVRRLARIMGARQAYGAVGEPLGMPLTAHFIGGCAIGDSPTTGVVDPYQRVYGYDGLHVVDGSTVSANLGVNPSLTITAQAERAMAHWPNKGEVDPRPAVGSAYVRLAPVEPKNPVVPEAAPGALRLPIVGVS